MLRSFSRRFVIATAVLAAFFAQAAVSQAETPAGSSVENRVLLGFKVDDAAAQAWLPEGWTLLTLPKGPLAGANVILVLMDRQLVRDAEGKPLEPPFDRAAALLSYGRKEGVEGVRAYITRVFETAPLANAYGNSVAAVITREAALKGTAADPAARNESWIVAPEAGGEIRLDLSYQAGKAAWAKGVEARPYSAANPDFHRIYRYDQLADLVMNTKIGRPLAGEVEFASSVPDLAPLFNGNEDLVAIIAVPVYAREVFLP